MVEKKIAYRILVGKPKAKRLLVRSRCRWEDSISTDLKEKE